MRFACSKILYDRNEREYKKIVSETGSKAEYPFYKDFLLFEMTLLVCVIRIVYERNVVLYVLLKLQKQQRSQLQHDDGDGGKNEEAMNIRVYNAVGQLVYKGLSNDRNTSISTHDWASGLYIVQVEVDGKSLTKKLIRN